MDNSNLVSIKTDEFQLILKLFTLDSLPLRFFDWSSCSELVSLQLIYYSVDTNTLLDFSDANMNHWTKFLARQMSKRTFFSSWQVGNNASRWIFVEYGRKRLRWFHARETKESGMFSAICSFKTRRKLFQLQRPISSGTHISGKTVNQYFVDEHFHHCDAATPSFLLKSIYVFGRENTLIRFKSPLSFQSSRPKIVELRNQIFKLNIFSWILALWYIIRSIFKRFIFIKFFMPW